MKALPVFFTGPAEDDLDQVERFIAADNPDAAARGRAAIVRESIQLGKMPERGMALRDPRSEQEIGVRLWPVSHYRHYLVLYRIEPELIRVLRILNAAQDWTRFFGKS
jgi:plasmid stabilization system protein ParE